MRKIYSDEIIESICKLIGEISFTLPSEVKNLIKNAYMKERKGLGKEYLKVILKNIEIAEKERIPVCQDTGMAVVFVEIGPGVIIDCGKYKSLENVINKGVEIGYKENYLRKSVVSPIERENTGTNTPAVIHIIPSEGDKFKMTVMEKGFGSENCSFLKMFSPGAKKEDIENFVLEVVKNAGPNPCPPVFIGLGIGGDFEKAAILSKMALIDLEKGSSRWEREILKKVNSLGIGPGGFGGNFTALGVKIKTFPTHIAGLPVAVNISCWAHRVKSVTL